VPKLRARRLGTARITRRREVTRPAHSPPPLGYCHTSCSAQEEHYRSAWTMPRRRSPGQYVQTPRHTWKDQWSSRTPLEHSDRHLSCRISPRCEASAAWAPGDTRLPPSDSGCFYGAEPDSGSESNSHDPTRECFHIDGAVETTDEMQDAVAGGRAPAAREDPRTPGNDGQVDPPPQEDRAAQIA